MTTYIDVLRNIYYQINPAFGVEMDKVIQQSSDTITFGDPVAPSNALADLLRQITNGLGTAANTARLSYTQYLDAMTWTRNAQAANAAGVPVEQYMQAATARNQIADIISPGSGGANVLGIPIWVILGGFALVLVMRN